MAKEMKYGTMIRFGGTSESTNLALRRRIVTCSMSSYAV